MLEPVGTAPGLVVPADGDDGRRAAGPARRAAARCGTRRSRRRRCGPRWPAPGAYEQRIMRLFGPPESEIAKTLREAERDGVPLERLEITTCLRRGEIEIATVFEPGGRRGLRRVRGGGARAPRPDGVLPRRRDDRRAGGARAARPARAHGRRSAESCTGGLMAGRLTDRAGLLRVRAGRPDRLPERGQGRAGGRRRGLIERHGAVSPEVAVALADGAIARLGADLGIGITGIAGPGGGSEAKPVGTVCLSVARARRRAARPHAPAARRPRDGARADDHRRDAPAAAAAGWAATERLFVALDLPAAARAALAAFRDAEADPELWRPVPDEALHVTLVFLGPPAARGVRCGRGGRAGVRGSGCRPRARRRAAAPAAPRAGAVRGGRGRAGVLGSCRAAGAGLAAAGLYEPERRPFRPHATVARLRAGARAPRSPATRRPRARRVRRRGGDALPLAAVARGRALRAARACRARLIVQRACAATGPGVSSRADGRGLHAYRPRRARRPGRRVALPAASPAATWRSCRVATGARVRHAAGRRWTARAPLPGSVRAQARPAARRLRAADARLPLRRPRRRRASRRCSR